MHAATACAVAVPCRAETAETALRLKFRTGEKSRTNTHVHRTTCVQGVWQQQQQIMGLNICRTKNIPQLEVSDRDLFPFGRCEACSLPRTGGVSLSRAASMCRSAFRDDRLG